MDLQQSVAPAAEVQTSPASPRLVAVVVISNLEYGGAQRQVVELVNRLEAENVTAYVCSLSAYVPLSKHLTHTDRLTFILRRVRFDFTVVFRLALFLRRVNADVVHAFLFDAEIASRLAGQLVRRPVIIGSERNTGYQLKSTDLIAFRVTRSLQDCVIANSRSGADFNSGLIGYPRRLYRVVRNGVDADRFRPLASQTIKQDLGIPAGVFVVGMFASFKQQKNQLLLLEAARGVLDRIPSVRFLFVGDALHKGMVDSDSYKEQLLERIDELRLREHCIFAGNRLDVETLYSACDLTVLPSLFEGTPNVLLESMACGVPVVATDVSDNRDIVPHGQAGFIVPSGDAEQLRDRILQLLQDQDFRERMSRYAREWVVQELSSERLAARTAKVYREAVAAKRDPRNRPGVVTGNG